MKLATLVLCLILFSCGKKSNSDSSLDKNISLSNSCEGTTFKTNSIENYDSYDGPGKYSLRYQADFIHIDFFSTEMTCKDGLIHIDNFGSFKTGIARSRKALLSPQEIDETSSMKGRILCIEKEECNLRIQSIGDGIIRLTATNKDNSSEFEQDFIVDSFEPVKIVNILGASND